MTDTGLQERLLAEARTLTPDEIRTRKVSVWLDEGSDEYVLQVGPSFRTKPEAVTIDATEELAELSEEAKRNDRSAEARVPGVAAELEARLANARAR